MLPVLHCQCIHFINDQYLDGGQEIRIPTVETSVKHIIYKWRLQDILRTFLSQWTF
jgi:hypothetical protein